MSSICNESEKVASGHQLDDHSCNSNISCCSFPSGRRSFCSHHSWPFHESTESVGAYDVMCGRHRRAFNNIGNRRFRVIINLHLKEYINSGSRQGKTSVILKVINFVRSAGGRFIDWDRTQERWVELSEKRTREKVGHAIRDMVLATSPLAQNSSASLPEEKIKIMSPLLGERLRQVTPCEATPVPKVSSAYSLSQHGTMSCDTDLGAASSHDPYFETSDVKTSESQWKSHEMEDVANAYNIFLPLPQSQQLQECSLESTSNGIHTVSAGYSLEDCTVIDVRVQNPDLDLVSNLIRND